MGQEPHPDDTHGEAEAERAATQPDEHRIRQRGYKIWVEGGRLEGRALDDWMRARWELERAPDPRVEFEQVAQEFEPGRGALGTLAASLKREVGFYFAPSQTAIDNISNSPKLETIAVSESADSDFLLKLAGADTNIRSGGRTEGFSIRVADAFEREASDHTVRVRVLARSASAAPTRLAIAYSTNEVGNSGWRWRDIGPGWAICELVWKVPKMHKGNGDFIGLSPDKIGTPGVEIHSVSVAVV